MRSILVLTLKDLRRRLAAPAGLLLNLAIPLVLAGTMALTFGGRGNDEENAAPVLRLLVVDLDEGPVARAITGAPQNPEAARRLEVRLASSREEGLRRLREEDFAALVIIPKGFSDVLLGGREFELEVVKNPAQSVMPIVAQQGAEVVALYLSIGTSLLGGEGPRFRALFEGKGWTDAIGIANMITALRQRILAVDDLLLPPLIEMKSAKQEEGTAGFNWLAWMFPGMMVMGLLFTGLVQMSDLLRERQWGTLRRQFAGPLGSGQVLLAKVVAAAGVVGLVHLALLAAGRLAFGIHWGPPGPVAAASLLITLAVTGFTALIYAVVRTERQGDALGGITVMLMSLLGGAFLPPQILPDWLQRLSVVTVSHWAHDALRVLATGGGWSELARHLPVLATLGSILIALAVALMARRHARGTL